MANDLQESTADLAAKQRLLDEIRKTELGRYLLDDLARRNVTLVVSSNMSAVNQGSGEAGAYWDPKARRIVVSPDRSLAKQLHYFAHETRHSAQFDVDMAFPRPTEVLHPVNFVLSNRLHEMDADAFAVYFVADHALKTKSKFFEELSQPEQAEHWLSSLLGTEGKISRAQMYTTFIDSWRENDKDLARAMRDAAVTLFNEPQINKYYDERCVMLWNKNIFPVFAKASKKPRSQDAKRVRQFFHDFRDGKFQSPQDNLEAHAKAYSKIFAEGGSPDYLAPVAAKVFHYLAEDAEGAQDIWRNQMPDMKERFNEARDFFCKKTARKKSSPAPSRAPKAAA